MNINVITSLTSVSQTLYHYLPTLAHLTLFHCSFTLLCLALSSCIDVATFDALIRYV